MPFCQSATQVFEIMELSCTLFKICVLTFEAESPEVNERAKFNYEVWVVKEEVVFWL